MDKITLANDVLFMCFTLLRLFHTFVLTSFLWSTLFPTVVFANKYARTPSDSIALKKYKRREYAQFNIGMHVLDPSEYDQTLHSPPSHTLSIPLGLSLEKTQRALDKLSFDSIYQRLSLVKDGFSWTALGLDFYLHYSGDLIVSRQELSDETRVIPTHFFLSNPHGALIFDDTLSFDKLILSGKDIVQKGDLSVNTLVLSNDGTFINENRVTTRQLILAPSTHTGANLTFINEGTFIGQKGSVIQGKGIFHNTPTGKVKTYQSLLLTQAEHLMLLNEGTFIAGGAIQGAFKGLINHGLFRAKQGFSDLTIHHFFNDTTGTIKGNGHIIVGTQAHEAVNRGLIVNKTLSLTLNGDFSNEHILHTRQELLTDGCGTFHQRGTLHGKQATFNNATIEMHASLDDSFFNIFFGNKVHSLLIHRDVILNLHEIHLARSLYPEAHATNRGILRTVFFNNGIAHFTNAHDIETTTWHQTGTLFTTEYGSTMIAHHSTFHEMQCLTNNGDLTFIKSVLGHIDTLLNNGGLTCKKQAILTGKSIHNTKRFIVKGIMNWTGEIFTNTGVIALADNRLKILRSFLNSGSFLWIHNGLSAQHIYNGGTVRRTSYLTAKLPSHPLIRVQDSAFNDRTFDNQGIWEDVITDTTRMDHDAAVIAYHTWHNSGTVHTPAITLDGARFDNTGTTVVQGDITGRSDQIHNTKELIAHGKMELEGTTFQNTGQVQTGQGSTYNGQRLDNTGDFSSKGSISGHVTHITNTGQSAIDPAHPEKGVKGFSSEQAITFSGETFTNEGALRAAQSAAYNGKQLTQTDQAVFAGNQLTIATTDPLLLRGAFESTSGVYLTAPTLDNHTTLDRLQGHIIIDGDLSNHRTIDLDECTHNGENLTNKTDAVFNIRNFHHKAALKRLLNQGIFSIRKGNLTIDELDNQGKLSLLQGDYLIKKWMDTRNSTSTIDQLTLLSRVFSFQGTVDIQKLIPQLYHYMEIIGDTTIRSGGFTAHRVKNCHTLSLGNGTYAIDQYTAQKSPLTSTKPILALQKDAIVTMPKSNNEQGEIISPVQLTVTPAPSQPVTATPKHPFMHTHHIRRQAYTVIPHVSDDVQTDKRNVVDQQTKAIMELLCDSTKVSDRRATEEERKTILQALMGSEITAHTPSNTSLLPTLAETHRHFKHFEILRLTEKLSYLLVQKIRTDGYEPTALNTFLKDYRTDFKTIQTYGDITQNIFMVWFKEVFDEHKEGFPLPSPTPPSLADQLKTYSNDTATPALWERHTTRTKLFNDIPHVTPSKGYQKKRALSKHTEEITGLLKDKERVDTTRRATMNVKKAILQAVMGTEITAFAHLPSERYALSLDGQLPTLTKTDHRFKHFEILRLATTFAKTLTQHAAMYGFETIHRVFDPQSDDCTTFATYSGLSSELFLDWFKEVFKSHAVGFPKPNSASLTFLPTTVPETTSPHSYGTIKAARNLILSLRSIQNNEESYRTFISFLQNTMFDIDRKGALVLDINEFINDRWKIDLPYHLLVRSNRFQNHKTLKTNGLTIRTITFGNGYDNDHMGTIECNGCMDIMVDGDVDLRFSILGSTDHGVIRSLTKNIRVGARKDIDKHTAVQNEAIVSSNKKLRLEALKGTIDNTFGAIFGGTGLDYVAVTLNNVSSEGISGSDMLIDVEQFNHLILDETYAVDTGRSGHDGGTCSQMYYRTQGWGPWKKTVRDWNTVATTSAIHAHKAKAKGSQLRANGKIIINSKRPPKICGSDIASYDDILWRHADGYLRDDYNGVAEISALHLSEFFISNKRSAGTGTCITPLIASGNQIQMDFTRFFLAFSGAISGRDITIHSKGLQARNNNGVRVPTVVQTVMISLLSLVKSSTSPLVRQQTDHQGTRHYTQNLPGSAQPISPIAVFEPNTGTSSHIPRSLVGSMPGVNTSYPFRPDTTFDQPTLERLFMYAQLFYTGGLQKDGNQTLLNMIKEGHAYKEYMLAHGKSITSQSIANYPKSMLFYLPEETVEGTLAVLMASLPPYLQVPYAGTSGSMQASNRVELLEGEEGLHLDGASIGSGKGGTSLKTTQGGHFTAQSQTRRTYIADGNSYGHHDSIAVSTLIESTADVDVSVDGAGFLRGAVDFEAGKGATDPHTLTLDCRQGLYGVEERLEAKRIEAIQTKRSKGIRTETTTVPVAQSFTSSGTTVLSGGQRSVQLTAPTFNAPLGTIIEGDEGAHLMEAHRIYQCEDQITHDGDAFKQKKTQQSMMYTEQSVGAVSKRGSVLLRSTKGDVSVTNVTIDDLTLDAANGIARILLGTNRYVEQSSEQGKSFFYQSASGNSEHHETFTESTLHKLTITRSLETVVQAVTGRLPDFMKRIKNDGGKLTYDFVKEIHESTQYDVENLTAEAALVLSLAASIATYGACSWIGGCLAASAGMTTTAAATASTTAAAASTAAAAATSTTLTAAGTLTAGVISAGLSTLATKAIILLANNQGDLSKTLNDLNQSNTLKSVAVAMSVAALIGGGSLKNARFTQHLTQQALRMSVQMGVESAIYGCTDGRSAGLTAIASSLCGYFSNQIGSAYTKGDFGYFTHKFLHALSGAASGAIIDGKEGAIAGAVGAAGVEVIADFMSPTGGMANDSNRLHYTDEQIQHTKDAARFTVILLGLAAGLNAKQLSVELALATIAIENNFEQSARYLGAEGTEPEKKKKEEKSTKQSTRADEVEIDSDHYLGANREEDTYFVTHEKHFRKWNVEKRELESQLKDARLLYEKGNAGATVAYAKVQGALTLHKVMRPVSPPRATMIRKTVGEIEERYVPQSVKSGMRNFSGALGECRAEVDVSWDNFIKAPSLQTWNDLALGSKVGFETLELLGAGVQKTFSAVRQGLRATGVSADTAQDSAWVAERIVDAYTLGKGGTSLATKLTSTAGAGTKVKNVTMLNANRLGSLDDLTIGRASNSNVTRVNQFDRIVGTGHLPTPANQTSLTRQPMRATARMAHHQIPAHAGANRGSDAFTSMPQRSEIGQRSAGSATGGVKADIRTQIALSASIPPEGCLLFRAQRIDETGKAVTVPVMIAGKVRGNIAVPTQSPYLKEGVDEALAAWKQVKEARAASVQQHIDQATGVDRASTRTQLFGTDRVATIDGQRVRPGTNGRRPQNYEYAGQYYTFDKKYLDAKLDGITDTVRRADITKEIMELRQKCPQGIYFSGTGHPDFSRHAARTVKIEQTINRKKDFDLANARISEITGKKFTHPRTDTWHHHQNKQDMLQIDKKLHDAISHTGGVSEIKGGQK